MRRPATFKSFFESATFYAAMATPVLGAAGGAWLGATSTLVGGVGSAIALGAAGAVGGLLGGAVIGLAGFFAANAVYKNKEYILAGAALVAYAPFALLGRGLKNAGQKLQSLLTRAKKSAADTNPPMAAAETSTSRVPVSGHVKNAFAAGKTPVPANDTEKPVPRRATPQNPAV